MRINGKENVWSWLKSDMKLKEAILKDAQLPGRLKVRLWRQFSDNEKKAINAALARNMPGFTFED